MADPIVVFAHFQAKPGQGAAVRAAIEACQPPSRAETANDAYDLHVVVGDDDSLMLHELWHSQAELDEHMKTPHFKTLAAALGPLLARPMTVMVTKHVS